MRETLINYDINSNVFDYSLIEERLKIINNVKIEHILSVDVCGSYLSYCLVRKLGDNIEIILAKTMSNNEKGFNEVRNLAKYFNVTKIVIEPDENQRKYPFENTYGKI